MNKCALAPRLVLIWLSSILAITSLSSEPSSAQAASAALPSGMLFFMPGNTCPAGSSRATNTNGRLLLVANDAGAIGRTYGGPLKDQDDRKHQHDASLTVTLDSHHVAGSGNCGNGQATSRGDHVFGGKTKGATLGLPVAYFSKACPIGWIDLAQALARPMYGPGRGENHFTMPIELPAGIDPNSLMAWEVRLREEQTSGSAQVAGLLPEGREPVTKRRLAEAGPH
ncbi:MULTISPECIES: hypothetical protein [unclassified Bradyrhizobium]|uniref:hypothetical protein n=1 Tax=unclassified Bradyrhizobium TaxID=2631580 RepID=UPI0028E7FF08|nr:MULTISPECIES: hypothetical protein [unclassified Bradyrhizobium]